MLSCEIKTASFGACSHSLNSQTSVDPQVKRGKTEHMPDIFYPLTEMALGWG